MMNKFWIVLFLLFFVPMANAEDISISIEYRINQHDFAISESKYVVRMPRETDWHWCVENSSWTVDQCTHDVRDAKRGIYEVKGAALVTNKGEPWAADVHYTVHAISSSGKVDKVATGVIPSHRYGEESGSAGFTLMTFALR